MNGRNDHFLQLNNMFKKFSKAQKNSLLVYDVFDRHNTVPISYVLNRHRKLGFCDKK